MASLKELLEQRASIVNNKSYEDLRRDVQQLSDAANKRLKRLGGYEEGRSSSAYQSAQNIKYQTPSGGRFGVKDVPQISKSERDETNARYKAAMEDLRKKYDEVSTFLKKKSSKISEIQKAERRTERRLGISLPSGVSKTAFWRAYRHLSEAYMIGGHNGMYDSTTFQKDLRRLAQGDRKMISTLNRTNIEPTGQLDKDIDERDYVADELAKEKVIRLPNGEEVDIRGKRTAEDIYELGRILIDSYGAGSKNYGTNEPPFGSDVT